MTSISSIKSLNLDLPPSCVAFCPTQPQYFVVGTYYLHANEADVSAVQQQIGENADAPLRDFEGGKEHLQMRTGSLILFRLEGETITLAITKDTDSAILDVQWTPHSQQLGDLLAVATSTGVITFYKLDTTAGSADLVLASRNIVADPSVLVLSLAWHPYYAHVIGITLSNGDVSICEYREEDVRSRSATIHINTIHHHDLEAWTLAFTENEVPNVISGGDDVVLQCSCINSQGQSFLWADRKLHQAGITAILPLGPDLIVTGSYDDHVRLISLPTRGRRQIQAELNLGGGVWRIKLLKNTLLPNLESTEERSRGLSNVESILILASCMHAGSRMIRLCRGGDGVWGFDVIAKFEEHESMNYGSDVQPSRHSLKSIVSTSFYDKLLCLWQFDMESVER